MELSRLWRVALAKPGWMALNYSNNATRDDLSVPLLHQREADNGKEQEKQGRQDHCVLNIDSLSDKTDYKRKSNDGKKKQGLQGRSYSGKYPSYEEEKQGSQDNSLNTGYSSDQTYNQRSDDIVKEQQIAAAGGKSSSVDYLKPTMVSIGPKYVFNVKHFKGNAQTNNQNYKKIYFNSFIGRGKKTTEDYREHLKDEDLKLVKNARKYYNDIGIKCPDKDDELVEMLLIDGGFVVEFVLQCKEGGNDDPRIKDRGKVARKDMLCFENQVPFAVLDALYKKLIDYTKETDPNPPSFIRLVKFAFASFAPNINLSNFYDDTKPEDPFDILHVLHSLCLPPINNNNPHQNQTIMEWPTVVHINSATELQDVGVSFNNTGEVYTMPREYAKISSLKESKDTTSLFDITFSGGVMKIPSFKVDGFTERFFRNMIALEQRRNLKPKYYTDYARLMDHLVDTNKDVTLLRKNGTIHNLLGEDKNVADLFNSVCVRVDITTNFYFAPLYTAVNRHCSNRRLVWAARLKTDYFSDPWKGVSSIAGAIVLSLGAALTLKSLLS